MSILNFSMKRQLDEANEKALTPVCSVHVQKIFALLHAKAVQAAEAKGVKIENTAADGNDPKNAVFHSAGEHMVVARSQKEGEQIEKKLAFEGITEYIKVFCGEDVAKSLKEDECFPLTDDDKGSATEVSEAVDGDHIFSRYLAENADMKYVVEDNADEDDDIDLDAGDDFADEDYGHDDDDEDASEPGENDEDNEDDEENNSEEGADAEGAEEGADTKDAENMADVQKADAFYVLYGLKIKGLKETTVSDALKQWGSNFLKGFGVTIDSLWGPGGSGDVHTIGGLVKDLKGLFGAIDDPAELANRVDEQIKKKFPSLTVESCNFRDKKTLIRELDKKKYSEGWPDGKNKQKINSADYSLVINVKGDDLKQPFLNRKIIANLVTMQIKGLFKKFKNMIKADDVIYLKGGKVDGNDNSSTARRAIKQLPASVDALYDKLFGTGKSKSDNDNTIVVIETKDDIFSKLLATVFKDETNDEYKTNLQNAWTKFYKKYTGDGHPDCTKKIFYDEFGKEYTKILKDLQNAGGVSVSEDIDQSIYTAYDIMRDLFESQVDGDSLTDIYEQPPDYLVLAEDDPESSGNKPLTSDQKSKLQGPIMDEIVKIANDTVKAKKNKVQFTSGMAKFARVDIDVCSNIENCEGARYNLIEPILDKAKKAEHPYFILAYFKIPKEIENSKIKGKGRGKKAVDEADILDEADNLTIQYLKKNKLSKDDALKDDVIEKIRGTYKRPPSVDKVKQDIETYFQKVGDNPAADRPAAKDGFTWKGTPGQEGFTEENMKKAFELAVDGKVYDFQRYTREAASDKFKYYDTDVPADVDVFAAFADRLKDVEPPPGDKKEKEVYFAVSEDLENPDLNKIQKFLNGENPVKVEDITDELLAKLQKEAEEYVSTLNISILTEADDNKQPDKQKGYIFDSWTPDPKNPPEDPNGKGPDGKDAIVICAKFKKVEDGGGGGGTEPEPKDGAGDDVYIIPMPGVTYNGTDNEHDFHGAGEEH